MPAPRKLKSLWRIFPLWAWIVMALGGAAAGWFLIPLFFRLIQIMAIGIGLVLHG